MIELIPAIDIIEGKCVRLTKGDYASKKVYADSPVDMAQKFEAMGFKRLHVVDLDGAKSHHVVNLSVLEGIMTKTHLKVDFGGGIKTSDDLRRVLETGATWATVGSIAATEPETFAEWVALHGAERFILGADVKEGLISINGWKQESQLSLYDFLDHYIGMGISHVLCTDISKDGMLSGTATALYADIMERYPNCRLIASGGVSSMADIDQLQRLGIPAVVFGKAIYEGRISLPELAEKYNLNRL